MVIYYTSTGGENRRFFFSAKALRKAVGEIEKSGGYIHQIMQSGKINWKEMNING